MSKENYILHCLVVLHTQVVILHAPACKQVCTQSCTGIFWDQSGKRAFYSVTLILTAQCMTKNCISDLASTP